VGEPLTRDPRLWRVILACGLAMFLVYTDFFAVQVALPDMAEDLDTTVPDLQWVISGYMLSSGAFLIVGGRLADILGRKTWLIIGVSIFVLTSLLGGLAVSAEMLIIMRIVQGFGAAVIMPVATAVVTNAFPAEMVQRAIGTVLGVAAAGQALGPLIGGVFTELFSWRWVLWLNVPVGLLVLVLLISSVNQSFDESAGRRIDWLGLGLVIVGIGVFTYAIDEASNWGWTSAQTWGMLLGGLAVLAGFVWWQLRCRAPLLDMEFFRNREFSVITAAGAVGNMATVVVIFLSVIFLQTVHGYSAITAAFAFLILSTGLTTSAQLAGRLGAFEPWRVMTLALFVGGLSAILMGVFTFSVPLFLVVSLFAGLGLGMTWAYANVVTQSLVPPAKAGAASGVVLTILIGLGGVATAVAASITASGGQESQASVLGYVLMGFGALCLVAAPFVVWQGRSRPELFHEDIEVLPPQ